MDVITYHVRTISRGKGRSAVQMAAYCGRDRLNNKYNGKTYDYTNRHDLVHHEIMLPDFAPKAFYTQEVLWNSVEKIEKNSNSRLARVACFALPKELDHDVQIEMVRQYVQECFVQYSMCADISIHDKGDGNPHVHLLLTTRSLDHAGEWMCKQRRNYLLDAEGNRIRDSISGRYKLGKSIKTNDWDDPDRIEEWRKGWAEACNMQFKQHGIQKQVTYMSFARQGIDRTPTIHLGAKVIALKERGIHTDRGDKYQEIIRNRSRDDWRQRGQEFTYERSR